MSANWDQRGFDRALLEYMKYTSRSLQEAVNTKAYYIARKALWFTKKADRASMIRSLGGYVKVQALNKAGRTVNRRILQLRDARIGQAPLAAVIINARRGRAGEKGLYGPDMARAIRGLLTARTRALGFIKSGWLPAIKLLAPYADKRGQPRIDHSVKQRGRAKGTAQPARGLSATIRAQIVNLASPIRDRKGALLKYGSKGLDVAFRDEAASMWEYIGRKMRPNTARFNRRAA